MSGNSLHMFTWHMQRKAMLVIIYIKLVVIRQFTTFPLPPAFIISMCRFVGAYPGSDLQTTKPLLADFFFSFSNTAFLRVGDVQVAWSELEKRSSWEVETWPLLCLSQCHLQQRYVYIAWLEPVPHATWIRVYRVA